MSNNHSPLSYDQHAFYSVYLAQPLKEGSSHAIKSARREMRRLQYSPGDALPPSRQDYMMHGDPHSYGGWPSSHLPPHTATNPHMAKWIQEQRDLAYQQTSYLRNTSSRPSQSLSSLIPERDDQLGDDPRKYPSYNRYHLTTTPSDSSVSDRRSNHPPYANFSVLKSVSKLHDPQYGSSNALGDMHYSRRDSPQLDQMSSCSSYTNEFPYKESAPNSLSCQPSSQGTGSQAYPSLVVEKLSMEVGCPTQVSSTGLSVTSVLDQLKKKKGNGLHTSELQEFEVDEIELMKQRMKLLFYEQEKQKQDQLKQQEEDEADEKDKMSEPPKEETPGDKMDPDESHDDLMVLTKLRQDLDSLKKLVSDQRKICKEIHFSKEREEQSLNNAEAKFKAQNVHHFVSGRTEDELQWKKDQKKKVSEWERVQRQKREHLHQIEAKELKAKVKLKAYEQHASELKRQIQLHEHSLQAKGGELMGSRDSEWRRVMSTDSITTGSSWMSSENPDKDIISIDSETNIQGLREMAPHSPDHSNASSPALHKWHHRAELYGSSEIPTSMHNPELAMHGIKITHGNSFNYEHQDERLRELHHNTSPDSMNSHGEISHILQQRKWDGQQKFNDSPPDMMYKVPGRSHWSHEQSIMSHDPYKGVSQDGSTSENLSLSSSTPDVIPSILAPYPRPLQQQRHSSGGGNPHMIYRGYSKAESLDLDRYHAETSRRAHSPGNMRSSYDYGTRPHDYDYDYSRDLMSEKAPPLSRYALNDSLAPEREHPSNRNPRRYPRPSSSTPHSYRLKRPDPPTGEERPRYRQHLSSSTLALASGEHIQRQQTEL